jgi:hypothetical protein
MKKFLIFMVMLVNVLALGFSQTGNSWTVTNSSTWIEAVNGIRSGGNGKTYTITVNGTVSVLASDGSTFGAVTGITVNIEGSGTLTLSNNGSVLDIGANQTVIAKDVTLRGRTNNDRPLVVNLSGTFRMEGNASITGNTSDREGGGVLNWGTFIMESGTISGNTAGRAGGVYNGGTFTMQGGTISGNTASFPYGDSGGGGGVCNARTFTMQGGTISNNTSSGAGGGVCVISGSFDNIRSTFTMQGGTISNNTSGIGGGGVYVAATGSGLGGIFTMQGSASISGNTTAKGRGGGDIRGTTFTMKDNASVSGNTADDGGGVYNSATFTMQDSASISGNTATYSGGGVCNQGGTFTMQDSASISGNTATYNGGGVFNSGVFKKTGGTIYGEDADTNQRNTVLSRVGNALYESGNSGWRNVTAGPMMNTDSYGFYLNDGDVVTFPSGFAGTWRRSNFNNTLTLTPSTVKSSSSDRLWILQSISGNAYKFKRADAANTLSITINLTNGNLVISGDSGSGQDNWNGTWYER